MRAGAKGNGRPPPNNTTGSHARLHASSESTLAHSAGMSLGTRDMVKAPGAVLPVADAKPRPLGAD
jgi:hypothetical protein